MPVFPSTDQKLDQFAQQRPSSRYNNLFCWGRSRPASQHSRLEVRPDIALFLWQNFNSRLFLPGRWETLPGLVSLPALPPAAECLSQTLRPPPSLPPLQPGLPGLPGRHGGGRGGFLPWRLSSGHQGGGGTWGWSCLVLSGASILHPLWVKSKVSFNFSFNSQILFSISKVIVVVRDGFLLI